MVTTGKGQANGVSADSGAPVPRSVAVASGGIGSTREMCGFGTALIADIMTGAVSPKVANPVCRTANVVLRACEMEQRHGAGNPLPLA